MEDKWHLCFSVTEQTAENVSQRETTDVSFCFCKDVFSIVVFSLFLKNRRHIPVSPIFFANLIKYAAK